MGKTNKKRSEYYFGSHSFKDAKQRRNRSIRTRNNSKAIEDFTTYPKKFQYPSKIRKVQQEENLINTNDFNPARCRITCGDYNYNTCNYSIGIVLLYWFNDLYAFKIQSFKKKCDSLVKIHNTKVFYLIRRCIDNDPSLRAFLFI